MAGRHDTEEHDAPGWEVCRAAVEVAVEVLGQRVVSAYAIGSLAHGGFRAPVSDVDVALLLEACGQDVPGVVEHVADHTRARLDSDLAERLSIFYGDWPTFNQPHPWARLGAIDRLDVIQHGVLVHGTDHRRRFGRLPPRAELVAATAAFLAKKPLVRWEPAALVAHGPRALTKTVLSPVRFLYTYATGRAGSNEDAAAWYSDSRRPATPLVRSALRWRTGVDPGAEAVALVGAYLADLQSECEKAFGLL
jgi:predicted nucleotidyltransferase